MIKHRTVQQVSPNILSYVVSILYYLSYFLMLLFIALTPPFLCLNYLPYKQPAPILFSQISYIHTKIYLFRQSWVYMLLLTITVNTDNNLSRANYYNSAPIISQVIPTYSPRLLRPPLTSLGMSPAAPHVFPPQHDFKPVVKSAT